MSEPGLRDRKRAQTRSRIAEAARTLALDAGIEHTTIEQIAQQADISPRTFFNYFASKEDAVLGIAEMDLTPERIDEHLRAVADQPAVEAVVALVFGVFGETFADAELRSARKEILHRFPQLMRRQMAHMGAVAETLTAAVRKILEQDAAWGEQAATHAAASMLLGMCMTALRTLAGPETKRPTVPLAVLEGEVVALVADTSRRVAAAERADGSER